MIWNDVNPERDWMLLPFSRRFTGTSAYGESEKGRRVDVICSGCFRYPITFSRRDRERGTEKVPDLTIGTRCRCGAQDGATSAEVFGTGFVLAHQV